MREESSERRGAERHCTVMDGQVMDLLTRATMKVRCSDIGLSGCYLDTLNPLEGGTPVQVRLENGGRKAEFAGRVAYKVARLGMGIEFAQPIAEGPLATLQAWVEELGGAAKPGAVNSWMSQ